MLLLTTLGVAALMILTLSAARNNLFPPVLFSGAWLLTLLGLLVVGDSLHAVSDYACLVFFVGGLTFSLGGVLMLALLPRQSNQIASVESPRITRAALDILLLILAVGLPYYVRVALQVADASENELIFAAVRRALVESEGANLFGPVAGNLNVLAPLVAIAMAYETDGTWSRRWRAVLATVLALVYGALTGSKLGAFFLINLFLVIQIRSGRIKLVAGLGAAAAVTSFFVGGLLLVNFYGQDLGSLRATASELGMTVASYWLGAPVAFGEIAERPDTLVSSENIGRFFVETARSLGLGATVPSLYDKYTSIGSGMETNTYTIYFSYFKDYGWLGMALLLAALGGFLTLLWRSALRGAPIATLMYALLCKGILLSFYAENFFVGLNGYIKAGVLYWFLYKLLPWIAPKPLDAPVRAHREICGPDAVVG